MQYIEIRRIALFKHALIFPNSSVSANLDYYSHQFVPRNFAKRPIYSVVLQKLELMISDKIPNKPCSNSCPSIPPNHRPFRSHSAQLAECYQVLQPDFSGFVIDHLCDNGGAVLKRLQALKRCFDGDVFNARETIVKVQEKARMESVPLRAFKNTIQFDLPTVEELPSASLQWLFGICAETIFQDADCLLGEFMQLEMKLYPKNAYSCLRKSRWTKRVLSNEFV